MFALLLVLLVLGEYLARAVPNPYKMKEQWMEKNAAEAKVMILGSSHAFYGVNPVYFDSLAFNLAYVSQGLEYDDYLLNRYLSKTPKLRAVFVSISAFSLFENLEHHAEWFRITNYQLYMGCEKYGFLSKYHFEMAHFWGATAKIKAYYLKRENTVNCSDLGYGIDYTLKNKNQKNWDNGSSRVKEHNYTDWRYLPGNAKYLENIADLCKWNHVKLIFFTTPARPSYYNNLYKNQIDCTYKVIHDLMKTHKNIVYLNFLKDSTFVSDDFYDQDHLSEVGAEKLTKILNESLR